MDGYVTAEVLQRSLAPLVESGKALKLAAEALLTFARRMGDAALREYLKSHKLELMSFAKPANRNPQFLLEFLKDKEPLDLICLGK